MGVLTSSWLNRKMKLKSKLEERRRQYLESFTNVFKFRDFLTCCQNLDDSQAVAAASFEDRKCKWSANIVLLCMINSWIFLSFEKANIRSPFWQFIQEDPTGQPDKILRVFLSCKLIISRDISVLCKTLAVWIQWKWLIVSCENMPASSFYGHPNLNKDVFISCGVFQALDSLHQSLLLWDRMGWISTRSNP